MAFSSAGGIVGAVALAAAAIVYDGLFTVHQTQIALVVRKRCFGPTFRIEAGSESLRFDLDCQA